MDNEKYLATKVAYLRQENSQLRDALLDAQIRLGEVSLSDAEDGSDE